ncbi:hypothetical protein [Ferrimonas balearica]|uniref:hypothetical protein n=1 Tax=Ferrimonas balearica TaxID=44012 RepID=UPI001C99BAEF|nr:hypothetical protein [Ferrimonas balearica]MBY5992503.1 hypothetical protein [Ferrimonas balearica]
MRLKLSALLLVVASTANAGEAFPNEFENPTLTNVEWELMGRCAALAGEFEHALDLRNVHEQFWGHHNLMRSENSLAALYHGQGIGFIHGKATSYDTEAKRIMAMEGLWQEYSCGSRIALNRWNAPR